MASRDDDGDAFGSCGLIWMTVTMMMWMWMMMLNAVHHSPWLCCWGYRWFAKAECVPS